MVGISMKKQIFSSIALIVCGLFLGVMFSSFLFTPAAAPSEESGQAIKYTGVVCVSKNNEPMVCKHNLFTEMGRNITKDLLGIGGNAGGALSNISYIALSNQTVLQAVGNASLSGEYAGDLACGLGRAMGTFNTNIISPGNWTVMKEFTSTCDAIPVNGTGLYNSSTGNFLFAENTFTTATLQTNDKINITWFIWVV